MQVMLSAPRPSEAARFAGHILSIIASTIFEVGAPGLALAEDEEPVLLAFVRLSPAVTVVAEEVCPAFFAGDVTPFLPIVKECCRLTFVFDDELAVVED